MPARGAEWLRADGRDSDVVMSSRVRLARNLSGFPFPNSASEEDRLSVLDLARSHAFSNDVADKLLWVDLTDATQTDRHILVERHLISRQHADAQGPRAVIVSSPDEWLSIMVNEEDHLRIQVLQSGLALSDAFARCDAVDDRLEGRIEYAFSKRFGYLTACPTNVGTGLRVSVMLHLPALRLTGEIEKVRRAANAMSLAVRGFYGEGSEAVGDIFQISNQTTLGRTERALLDDFEREIIPEVIGYERSARRALLDNRRLILEDRAHRSLATLRSARLLSADEALRCLSHARLGVRLGVLEGVDPNAIDQLILLTQPAHLQQIVGRKLDQSQRKSARADLVRKRLGG